MFVVILPKSRNGVGLVSKFVVVVILPSYAYLFIHILKSEAKQQRLLALFICLYGKKKNKLSEEPNMH